MNIRDDPGGNTAEATAVSIDSTAALQQRLTHNKQQSYVFVRSRYLTGIVPPPRNFAPTLDPAAASSIIYYLFSIVAASRRRCHCVVSKLAISPRFESVLRLARQYQTLQRTIGRISLHVDCDELSTATQLTVPLASFDFAETERFRTTPPQKKVELPLKP